MKLPASLGSWDAFSVYVSGVAHTETGRLLATVLTLIVSGLLLRIIQRRAARGAGTPAEIARRRSGFVLIKNLILLTALIIVVSIWASKIAGAALSLAAVTGAVLIVSKEFLVNLLGSAQLAISRSYSVGDYIEIDGISGRVLDSDMLATTLVAALDGNQLTGRTVTLPHSLLLTRPVHNLTATGEYVIHMLRVAAHPEEDLGALKDALLRAANEVCGPWLGEADRHLKRVESRDLVDLPSSEPKVLLKIESSKEAVLALRYTCRPNDRVRVEQAILWLFLTYRPAAHRLPPGAVE